MRSAHRGAGLLFALSAACVMTLSGTVQASAADPTATWTLSQTEQRICVAPERGWPDTYYLASVTGSSESPIDHAIRELPSGSFSNGGTIHPGELNPSGKFLGFGHISIAPAPVGEYIAQLWASDGTSTQTAPLRISVKEDCLSGT
ncbi:DUF5980 family protein [Streptomyces sp. NPDC048565]|uniref:DUF5980 family protein n=1 Tax=Streptomyces sp. NPDC048565 TaxID=3155266 RepID=UPI00343FC111